MDFHSLLRRDLQSLCKINKIPANMTNLAMADALKSLEIVEGLDEYMNQADSNVLQSPTSVAKLPPSTATRTSRRKTTAVKPEPQSSRLTSKSLDGDVEQENMLKNVAVESKANNVKFEAKTPAARSTRKVSCSSNVQESKKVEMVQSAYSTRRSTRLLEKCMADLSLNTLDKPEKIQETEQQVSAQEKNPAGSEERIEDAEVVHCRDLSASMEKEGEVVKNDSDHVPVLTINDNKESKNFEAIEAIQENVYEPEKTNTVVEETMVDQTDGASEDEPEEDNSGVDSEGTISEADSNQADYQEIEQANQDNDSKAEKINTFDEETMLDQTDDGSEQEGDDTGADSDGTISEADSYQAKQGSDIDEGKVILPESKGSVTAPASTLVLEEVLVETTPLSPSFVAESVSAQFPRPNKSASKNSAMKLVNVENATKENNMEMMMMNVVNGESKGEEAAKKNKKVEMDEESLKDVSMRQLVKMVKKLSIKSSNNRTALQMLPGNNQIAE